MTRRSAAQITRELGSKFAETVTATKVPGAHCAICRTPAAPYLFEVQYSDRTTALLCIIHAPAEDAGAEETETDEYAALARSEDLADLAANPYR